MSTFDLGTTGVDAVNTILAEEANRIGKDIYSNTLHTSPWLDLTKQSVFADGMGYQQATLVYDRAIALSDASGGQVPDQVGALWSNVGTPNTDANVLDGTSKFDQHLKDAADDMQGGRGKGGIAADHDTRSFIKFSKKLKSYSLKRAIIESPRISLEDLRFAAHRQDQLRAIMDLMTQVTRNTWENRYRDEYHTIADNVVRCATSATVITAGEENTLSLPTSAVTGNISNAVLDKCYYNLIRKGAGAGAYGRENGRPVFACVLSSEASYFLQTEAGFRDDIRYNNAKVSDLIAPLGVEKAFRGFYHLVDDMAPRFAADYSIVPPYDLTGDIVIPNASYEGAQFEAAFIMHPEVCESLIPNPLSGSNGLSFNPVNYRGKFDWKNILSEATNPDGTVGFFRGILASATKPIKTDFGYVVLFDRTSSTPSA